MRPSIRIATPATNKSAARFSRGRFVVWGGYALLIFTAPWIWTSSFSMTLLSQMGVAVIACLALNILLGQGGMLSFGHAVYSGLGSFLAIHVLNLAGAGQLHIPASLIPLAAGIFSMLLAALLGSVTTKRAGTPFAMITLGIGELVAAFAPMFPSFFGGEGGISGNRAVGQMVWGVSLGPQIHLYYLIAVYTYVCTALMFALTATPLGRLLNAVRDNPERVALIGYDPQVVRYLAFIASGFFMGVAGGLAALDFETVTAEVIAAPRSGAYVLFTVLGGAATFYGPIIGGIFLVLCMVLFSTLTPAWLLYLGLIFIVMVMYAPGGISSLIMLNLHVASHGRLRPLLLPYVWLAAAAAPALVGASAMIEMLYRLQLNAVFGDQTLFLGVKLSATAWSSWLAASAALAFGITLFRHARKGFMKLWKATHEAIELEILQGLSER